MTEYTLDLTAGETFDASDAYSGNEADKAFDDNGSTFWFILGPSDPEWIEVQFATARTIARVRIEYNIIGWDDGPDQVIIKASNTGAFGGEETTLHTSASGLTWSTAGAEWKEFDFTNTTAYTYWRVYCIHDPAPGHDLLINEIEMMEEEATPGEYERDNSEAIDVSDSVDAFNCTDEITQNIGAADDVDGVKETEPTEISETIEITDDSDGFNWSAWFRANRDRSVIRYYCTLTGAADGLSDLTIPISSFQATKRTGESTYLSVSVPGVAQAEEIADRSNGELVIYMAYLLDGVESLREEILRVELEQINPQEGARSRSINLIGHKTVTYDARAVAVQGCNYKYTSGGSRGFRFPQADPYLNPGDALTVVDTEDVLTVDYITYAISAKGAKFMEVREG